MRKQSKRVAMTKEAIEIAYLDALEEENGRKVSVKEICERAGVNRTTFYKYYKDVDELGMITRQNILADLEQILKETVPEDYSDIYEFVSRIILNMHRSEKIRKLPLLYHETEVQGKLEGMLWRYYYSPKFGSCLSEDEWMLITFCHCGALGLIEAWIQGGMRISPEKIANCVISFSKHIRSEK